jgi:hypothetical protein
MDAEMTSGPHAAQRENGAAPESPLSALHACRAGGGAQIRGMFRRLALFALCGFALIAAGAEMPISRYDQVAVAPAKTSIYVGTVALTMPTLGRQNGVYEASYSARVFPFFFYNEQGRLAIEISDDLLRRLERGEPVEFKGRGVRDDGAERRVEGKATPSDAVSGKLKVRVFYSKRVELIFNTTYRFGPG